jgi:ubiquinone/menaquinone biosynthesis C-methylase UbiE
MLDSPPSEVPIEAALNSPEMREPNELSFVTFDGWGPTREEHEFLQAGLPVLHPRRWFYEATKLGVKSRGRLSQGVRLGLRTGFASGQTLDYVYANEPRGSTFLGRLIDRGYLNAVGWRCIRVRRQNLEELITLACRSVADQRSDPNQPIRIVDVAGGPGRYLVELVHRLFKLPLQVVIRDQSSEGLAEGRALASKLGLSARITHEVGDAFSPASLATLGTEVDVAVVSGLWELFDSNQPIRACLEGLAAVLPTGAYFVYTNQPWHPQLEQIAELLTDRGQPWVMRRRSQAEADELVLQAGFEKIAQRIDDEGIFTVALARRK